MFFVYNDVYISHCGDEENRTPPRTLQVFIASLGTCDPKLKDLYTGFEPVTISGELPELSPSIAVYQFRQYKSFVPCSGIEPLLLACKTSTLPLHQQGKCKGLRCILFK